jgi:hypothetical protein
MKRRSHDTATTWIKPRKQRLSPHDLNRLMRIAFFSFCLTHGTIMCVSAAIMRFM